MKEQKIIRAFEDVKSTLADGCLLYTSDDKQAEIPNILELCEKEGNPDMVFEFCSTSKVTVPGAGLAGICTSEKNRDVYKRQVLICVL